MAKTKPAVVTILGHVDHGKTTLLDKIRKSNLAAKESGGITQHISAYQIEYSSPKYGKNKITFIDTPGHAAFAKMRARGAKVTDLAILVIAADQGVQEQTKESLSYIKEAQIPYLIALSKVDLPKSDPEKVKEELMEMEIELEDLGGNIPVVLASAISGKGIVDLLETVVSMSRKLELKADFEGEFQGVVIESSLDPQKGILNTILVKNGTLKVKDEILINENPVKVKAMFNDLGKAVKVAFPADPVVVLGLPQALEAGSFIGRETTTQAKKEKKEKKEEEKDIFAQKEEKLALVIKADAKGTLEAILANLPPEIQIVHSGLGEVTDTDLFLAQAAKAQIIAFRVKISPSALKLSAEQKITIKEFKVIYQLLEETDKAVLRLLSPDIEKEVLGMAQVVAEFEIEKKRVAGCRVLQGEINRQLPVSLKRKEQIIGEVKIISMKHLKEDVQLAKKGQEFGAVFFPAVDFEIGDVIISYRL